MEAVKEQARLERYAAYKDSGVEWLGEIPEHWEVLPLFSVSKIRSEKNNPDLDLLSVYLDLGVIKFSDIKEKRTNVTSLDLTNYQKVHSGDLVLNNQQAWRGSVGVSKHTGIVSPAYIILKLSDKFDSKYANYMFRNSATVSQYLISSKGVGTIQRNLYWPQLRSKYISLPPPQEQTAIATFLDAKCGKIERAIAQKQELIELLKERKQIIIQNAVTKGLDPEVKMKDSGVEWIGEIPEHWEMKKLKYVLSERSERTLTGEEPLLMMSQIYGLVVRSDFHEKAEVSSSNVGNKVVYQNDLVFNKLKAHLGVFFKSSIEKPGIVSPDYAVYYSKGKIENLKLLEIIFRHPAYIEQFIIKATGIVEGLIRLYTGDLFEIKVPLPPRNEQKEILKFTEKASEKVDKAIVLQQQQIEKLKEYKSSLIDAAVTGKVKVKG